MEIHTRRVKDVVIADLIGRLESQTCGPASTELNRIAQAGDRKVLLNLTGLVYLSSAGLARNPCGGKAPQEPRRHPQDLSGKPYGERGYGCHRV